MVGIVGIASTQVFCLEDFICECISENKLVQNAWYIIRHIRRQAGVVVRVGVVIAGKWILYQVVKVDVDVDTTVGIGELHSVY